MISKWSFGASKLSPNAPQCNLWGQQKRTRKKNKSRFTQDLGLVFRSHFWLKSDARNEVDKRWVSNGVLGACWQILGTFMDSLLRLVGPWRPKKGERVNKWTWAPRWSETLSFKDYWGSFFHTATRNQKKWHIIFEVRCWITAWGHVRRFEASKLAQNSNTNDVENEVGKKEVNKWGRGETWRCRTR